MSMLSQKDQLALHEFSVRMRQAISDRYTTKNQDMDAAKDALRQQYEMERSPLDEPAKGSKEPTPQREPEAPEP